MSECFIDVTVVTVTTRNYLHRAKALMARVREFMPEARRLVCCADPVMDRFDPEGEFELVEADTLGIPRYRQLVMAINPTAVCCALKPYAVKAAWSAQQVKRVIYLDNDMDLYRCPAEMLNELEVHSVVLTPHHLAPLPSGSRPDEMTLKSFGIFNAGMFGVSNVQETREFMEWWAEWMLDPRRLRYEMGYDQCWLDYVPVYCASAKVLTHSGYNVAFWNLVERNLRLDGDMPMCGSVPLTTFHFSGFDESVPEDLRAWDKVCTARASPATIALGVGLANEWSIQGSVECGRWGYAFSNWWDGEPVTDRERELVREMWDKLPPDVDLTSDRFAMDHPSLFRLIRPEIEAVDARSRMIKLISRLMDASPRKVLNRMRW